MKYITLIIVTTLSLSFVYGQNKENQQQRVLQKESQFLSRLNLNVPLELEKLIECSSQKKINDSYSEGSEEVIEQDGRIYLTRRFDVEFISKDLSIVNNIKAEMERRIESSGLKIKKSSSYPQGFNIDYISECTVGSVDVRFVLGSGNMLHSKGNTYQMFFIFHESYCNR
jgi:hypothetical protein